MTLPKFFHLNSNNQKSLVRIHDGFVHLLCVCCMYTALDIKI